MSFNICLCEIPPFLDGNKRSAIYLAERFAVLNGLNLGDDYFIKMEKIVVELAENKISKDELKNILNDLLKQDTTRKTK